MAFINTKDLFQRKLIHYEIKHVTLDTSLSSRVVVSVWKSDRNVFAWVTQYFCSLFRSKHLCTFSSSTLE